MRRLLLVLAACAGCDSIWRLDTVHDHVDDAPPIDAPADVTSDAVDAPPGSISISVSSTPALWVGDQVTIQAFVHGPPNAPVMASQSATRGTVSPPTASLTLDGNGVAELDVIYTAPQMAGTDAVTYNAMAPTAATMTTLPLNIAPLMSFGIDVHQATNQLIGANAALGARISLPSGGDVRKVGFWSASAGAHVRVGVYTVDPSNFGPLMRQTADLGAHTVVIGRNEIDVTPITLLSGSYWLVAVFDGPTQLEYANINGGLYGTANFNYGTLPAQWSATWNDISNTTFAFFLRIGM